MARAVPQSLPNEFGQHAGNEWQSLRGELEALLDQVESRTAPRNTQAQPAYQGLAERVRDLRFQVAAAEAPTGNRHSEALRSVQRAVDRFSDRGEERFVEPGGRDSLESAINQIRARQGVAPAPTHGGDGPRLGQLAQAVGGIGSRLERLEGEIKTQGRGAGNIKDVAEQVAQLAHVVELLAGAVGETGQVKRLEGQIASLANLVAQGRDVDLSALTHRLDDVSATVGRLADLQVQFADRVSNPAQNASVIDAMTAIEASVRNVYDRIDTLEKTAAISPADVDHLTGEMARFMAAIDSGPMPSHNLVELIDALNQRIGELESGDRLTEGLRGDLATLRDTVVEAFEPRFAGIEKHLISLSGRLSNAADFSGIEQRIDALGERLGERADPGLGQLEAQVRQLVARMDQTGEQLAGLAKLYTQAEMPDAEALADMVADRTSAAVSRLEMFSGGLTKESLDDLEARVTALLKTTAGGPEAHDFGGMESGIREVGERLARLEATLTERRDGIEIEPHVARGTVRVAAPDFDTEIEAEADDEPVYGDAPVYDAEPWSDNAPSAFAPRHNSEPEPEPELAPAAPAEMPAAKPVRDAAPHDDFMPASPTDDAPLNAPAFSEPAPLSGDAWNGARKRHPGLEDDLSLAARFDAPASPPVARPTPPAFDAAAAALPPAPKSSLGIFEPPEAPAAAAAPVPVSTSSRNTFIEAARRAAQRQSAPATLSEPGSLIGRALARFQTATSPAGVPTDEPKSGAAKRGLFSRRRVLAGDEPAPNAWTPEAAEPHFAGDAAQGMTPAEHEPAATDDASDEDAAPGFLARYRKPILLAAAVLALVFLTLNLVVQRLGQSAPDATPTTTGDIGATALPLIGRPTADIASATTPPRVITMADAMTTGSVGTNPSQGFTAQPQQPMPAAFKAPAQLTSTDAAALIPPPEAIVSPISVELPPEGVGPIELRQAAADGNARAQFEVGAILTEGRALPLDYKAAAIWYERAAAQGFAPAQYRLGSLYESGNGVDKDLNTARLWYERAAEAGNRMSMHNLAALYAGGQLGKQQFDAAAKWFEEAAARGMTDSQFNLGMLYARGLGVPQSLENSYKWFGIAARSGDKDAAKARDDIARSLDAATADRLNSEIAAWTRARIDLAANFAPIGTWSSAFDPGETITSKDIVASVQGALDRLGFDVGTADGVAGPKTIQAIKAFERGTGMSEMGAINPRLLAVLGSQPV